MDLSNSPQGAGGVGGLLAIERHTGSQTGVHFASHDGNGNVVALTDAGDGEQSASYEYDPLGNLLEMSGVFAAQNPYRFSTKRQDALTGLYHYGYRSYDPVAGRWLSRDPIAEDGGLNLYGFVGNGPIGSVDVLGNRPVIVNGVTIQLTDGSSELSLDTYWEIFSNRWKDRDFRGDREKLRKRIIGKGCIGITCANLGKVQNAGKLKRAELDYNNCFFSRNHAETLRDQWRQSNHCCNKRPENSNLHWPKESQQDENGKPSDPVIFSIHLWNDVGRDQTNPDVRPVPGDPTKASLSNWDRSPYKVGETAFDYGYLNSYNLIEHATSNHNPPHAIMRPIISTLEKWSRQPKNLKERRYGYINFNEEVWCVTCEGRLPPRSNLPANFDGFPR